MGWQVLIAHAEGEEGLAERLAEPIREAGYEVVHRGTALVGESVTEEASRALSTGGPVVLCGTIRALGTGWVHRLVNAAHQHPQVRVFAVQMEQEAYVQQLSFDVVVARYWQDPTKAVQELMASLQKYYPLYADGDITRGKETDAMRTNGGADRAEEKKPSFLPGAYLEIFVGRVAEMEELRKRLTTVRSGSWHRPIVVTGMGGVGKTSLVRKVLEELWQEDQSGPAIYTEKEVGSLLSTRAASGTGAEDFTKAVLERIAGAFGYTGDSPADFLEKQGSKILVVLDGADVEWSVLENLLERLTHNIVIVTTRTAALNRVAYVPIPLEPFQEDESLTLFQAILAARDLARDLTRDEAEIRQICEQYGHLPLAIRVLASLVANYNLLLKEVLIPGQLISGSGEMSQCFDLSYTRLSEDDKRLFVLCSLFGGPSFSRASVRQLARDLVESPDSCLNKLIELSLVNNDPAREGRHSLHALVWHYAREKQRWVNWGRRKVNQAFLVRRLAEVCLGAIKEEAVPPRDDLDNAVTVIDEWCKGRAYPRVVVQIVDAVDNHLYRQGFWEQRQRVLQQGIDAAAKSRAKDQPVPRYLLEKGRTYSYQNRYSEAATALEESARLFETQGDAEQAARVYAELGLVYRYLRDWRTAKERLETGLRVLSDQPLTYVGQLAKSRCHINLAAVCFDYGDEGNAERHLTEAEETLEPLQGRTAELPDDAINELADVIHGMGNVCFYSDQLYSDQGFEEDPAALSERLQKAGEKYAEAIKLLSLKKRADMQGTWVLAFCYDHQSQWCFRAGELSEAEDHANRALKLFREIGQRDGEAYSYDHLGECHMAKGYRAFTEGKDAQRGEAERKLAEAGQEYGQAAELFEQALKIFTELAKRDAQGWLLHHLGEVRENLGDLVSCMAERGYEQGTLLPYQVVWEQARKAYTTAFEIFKELGLKKYYLHLGLHLVEIRIKQRAGCLPPEADEYRRIVAGFFDKDFYRRLYGKPTQDAP